MACLLGSTGACGSRPSHVMWHESCRAPLALGTSCLWQRSKIWFKGQRAPASQYSNRPANRQCMHAVNGFV